MRATLDGRRLMARPDRSWREAAFDNQVGPCGILCGACPLGNCIVAGSAGQTRKHIADCQIPMWAPFVPGGEAIDWTAVDRGLDWMQRYARWPGGKREAVGEPRMRSSSKLLG